MSFDMDYEALFNNAEFKALAVHDFLELDIKPREHILSPWLPAQGLAMIYAPRGIGKTYVALSIASAIVRGTSFLKWNAPAPRSVLYIDGEMPAITMQERLTNITRNQPEPGAAFHILTPDLQPRCMPDLADPLHQSMLDSIIEDFELIIIDNISTLCRTKENDADAWSLVQNWALRMRAKGKSVLFIHHAGKAGNQRGTSKREDILDTVVSLEELENHNPSDGAAFEVHFKKARGFCGEAAEPFTAKMSTSADGSVQWEMAGVKASVYNQVIELLQHGVKQQDIAEHLQINKSNVSRYAARAKLEGKLRSCVA